MTQIKLTSVLIKSLRSFERHCMRDIVLLVGQDATVDATANASLWQLAHRERGVFVRIVPPLVEGKPTADKIHAWRLVEYDRVVVTDGDVLAIQPWNALFESVHQGIVLAQHAYDLEQAKCGLPIGRRGNTGLFTLRPSQATFERLLRTLHTSLDRYAEQTILACYYEQQRQLQTLGCHYLFDVSNEIHLLPQVVKRCRRWARDASTASECAGVAAHVRANCSWYDRYDQVAAVHFKGKSKPWHYQPRCRPVRFGRLVLLYDGGNLSSTPPTDIASAYGPDDLIWADGRCVSRRLGVSVGWYEGPSAHAAAAATPMGEPIPRECCTFQTLLQAEWYHVQDCSQCRWGH